MSLSFVLVASFQSGLAGSSSGLTDGDEGRKRRRRRNSGFNQSKARKKKYRQAFRESLWQSGSRGRQKEGNINLDQAWQFSFAKEPSTRKTFFPRTVYKYQLHKLKYLQKRTCSTFWRYRQIGKRRGTQFLCTINANMLLFA